MDPDVVAILTGAGRVAVLAVSDEYQVRHGDAGSPTQSCGSESLLRPHRKPARALTENPEKNLGDAG